MDMVEKVREAVSPILLRREAADQDSFDWATEVARAAIEAMREPTNAMMLKYGSDPIDKVSAKIIWQSTIDQALSDQPRADPGIPIHPTSLVEKGIPGLATIRDATDDVLGKDGV